MKMPIIKKIEVSRKNFKMNTIPDELATDVEDAVGVRASVEIRIRNGDHFILQEIETPGLWAISSDDTQYIREVYLEECQTLEHMLRSLNIKITD